MEFYVTALSQVFFLDPLFPWGKFHLRICWDIKSWLAQPRGRPPIGCWRELCRKIISRLYPILLFILLFLLLFLILLHLRARHRRYLSWKLYLKSYLSWKLLNIGFPQQTCTPKFRAVPCKSRPPWYISKNICICIHNINNINDYNHVSLACIFLAHFALSLKDCEADHWELRIETTCPCT